MVWETRPPSAQAAQSLCMFSQSHLPILSLLGNEDRGWEQMMCIFLFTRQFRRIRGLILRQTFQPDGFDG